MQNTRRTKHIDVKNLVIVVNIKGRKSDGKMKSNSLQSVQSLKLSFVYTKQEEMG